MGAAKLDRHSIIENAVRAGAAAMLKFDASSVDVRVKSTAGDFVTEADLASEQSIMAVITASFPRDIIISEETKAGQNLLVPDQLSKFSGWVMDPIDGTNNYKRDLHFSGVSLAYVEHGEVVLGAIFDPYRDEFYFAKQGGGATCNGATIQIGSHTRLSPDTRVVTGNNYAAGGTLTNLEVYNRLGHVWVDVLGCAVLVMADIACGRLDLYFHNGLSPWDNAAGFLIVAETGGKITDWHGRPVTWLAREMVLGNPVLVDAFVAALAQDMEK